MRSCSPWRRRDIAMPDSCSRRLRKLSNGDFLELVSELQTWNANSVQKTIVVTGAAGGLGVATTAALVAAGHRVVGVDLHGADEKLDVTDPAACRGVAR